MSKLHAQIKDEGQDDRKSRLFNELFQFQTRLGKYDDDGFFYQLEVRELMYDIDGLLEMLIEETETKHLE